MKITALTDNSSVGLSLNFYLASISAPPLTLRSKQVFFLDRRRIAIGSGV